MGEEAGLWPLIIIHLFWDVRIFLVASCVFVFSPTVLALEFRVLMILSYPLWSFISYPALSLTIRSYTLSPFLILYQSCLSFLVLAYRWSSFLIIDHPVLTFLILVTLSHSISFFIMLSYLILFILYYPLLCVINLPSPFYPCVCITMKDMKGGKRMKGR